jgi:hypothetical protein
MEVTKAQDYLNTTASKEIKNVRYSRDWILLQVQVTGPMLETEHVQNVGLWLWIDVANHPRWLCQ